MKKFLILIMALVVMLMAMPAMASTCDDCFTDVMHATADAMPSADAVFRLDAYGASDTVAPWGAYSKETINYINVEVTLIDYIGSFDPTEEKAGHRATTEYMTSALVTTDTKSGGGAVSPFG